VNPFLLKWRGFDAGRGAWMAGVALVCMAALLLSACEGDSAKAKSTPVSAGGYPDIGFGASGLVTYNNGVDNDIDQAETLAVQGDGKIVAAGFSVVSGTNAMLLARFNANGTPDTAFGVGGVILDDHTGGNDAAHGVVVQPDNKIVVVGEVFGASSADMAVWRFNGDGTPDATFSGGGFFQVGDSGGGTNANDRAWGVTLGAAGDIIVVGDSADAGSNKVAVVWMFDNFGVPVGTFGSPPQGFQILSNGLTDTARAAVIDGAGNILISGSSALGPGISPEFVSLWRISAAGVPDPTLGAGGQFAPPNIYPGGALDRATALRLDSKGMAMVSGTAQNASAVNSAAIWRVNTTVNPAVLDPSFGGPGWVAVAGSANFNARGLVIDGFSNIYATGTGPGTAQDMYLWRFLADGSLDPAFAGGLGAIKLDYGNNDAGMAIKIAPSGHVIVAGSVEMTHAPGPLAADVAIWSFQ